MRNILCLVVLLIVSGVTAIAGTLSGTLNAPASGQTATLTWQGGPLTGATQNPPPCTTITCDTFTLTLNVPTGFYTTNPNYALHVNISWALDTNDFDLFLFDSNNNLIASSAQGGETFEEIDAGPLPSGTYTIQVVTSLVVNSTYNGLITLGPEPAIPAGKARYKPGSMTFSTPFELQRPNNAEATLLNPTGVITFFDQDVEPRAVHDVLGNIYVAAIQGVGGGIDLWRSFDGGKSFKYLGQPDGTQAVAALGPNGVGVGGGDEDIVIGSSGHIYASSLWLGGVTDCSSFDGATTFTCNFLASDIPANDRQWNGSFRDNIVYLTTKQLGGVVVGATPSIIVTKSFDGGLTFPQISEVTKPVFGVQPGDQGNMVVDHNNGNVYLVFIGAQNNQVYVARSSDGGQSWILKLVFQAPNAVSEQHVFPAIAVDRGSNLHIVFSDGVNVFLTSSNNQGASWTTPVRVNNGAGTKTAVEPWVTAGDPGKVDITWFGSSVIGTTANPAFNNSSAQWQVFVAQTQNAFANVPTFFQNTATGIMHVGAICVNGLACPAGTRNLAEYFYPDTYLDGNILIPFPDDKDSHLFSGAARTWFVKQTGGPTVGPPQPN